MNLKKHILILLSLFLIKSSFSQKSAVVIKYDSIKIVSLKGDTIKQKSTNFFYFNKCSVILISETPRIYDIIIPCVHKFDVTGIRVLEDIGVQLEDEGVIYESSVHKMQVAVYFSDGMETVKIMRKDKTGVIFY